MFAVGVADHVLHAALIRSAVGPNYIILGDRLHAVDGCQCRRLSVPGLSMHQLPEQPRRARHRSHWRSATAAQRPSAGAEVRTGCHWRTAILGVPAPAAGIVRADQNPSRPSVTAGQPHPSSCLVNVHAKTALTEPARTWSWQLSGAGTRVARVLDT